MIYLRFFYEDVTAGIINLGVDPLFFLGQDDHLQTLREHHVQGGGMVESAASGGRVRTNE